MAFCGGRPTEVLQYTAQRVGEQLSFLTGFIFRHGGHPHEHPQPVIGRLIAAGTSAESEAEGFKTTSVFKEIKNAMKEVNATFFALLLNDWYTRATGVNITLTL